MGQKLRLLSFFAFPGVVLFAHLILSKGLHLYKIFPHLDIPVHYLGGLSIAYASARVLSYLEKEKRIASLDRVIFLVLLLCLTATATVLWEFMEFAGDQVLGTNLQVSLANTMQDLLMGILGGATWVFLFSMKPDTIEATRNQS